MSADIYGSSLVRGKEASQSCICRRACLLYMFYMMYMLYMFCMLYMLFMLYILYMLYLCVCAHTSTPSHKRIFGHKRTYLYPIIDANLYMSTRACNRRHLGPSHFACSAFRLRCRVVVVGALQMNFNWALYVCAPVPGQTVCWQAPLPADMRAMHIVALQPSPKPLAKSAWRPTQEALLEALRGLYADELKPLGMILRKRLLEGCEASSGKRSGFDVSLSELQCICRECPLVDVEADGEQGGDWAAVLCNTPGRFVDPSSPKDEYTEVGYV